MERYEILSKTNREEYLINCPILLLKSSLTYDNEQQVVLAQFKLQNLSWQIIKAVYIKVLCSGIGDEPLENVDEFIYTDLNSQPYMIFGGDVPICLPDNNTRNVMLSCTKIVFANDTVWHNRQGISFKPLPQKQHLKDCLSDELYDELIREISPANFACQDIYVPEELENIRLCPCGTYYLKGDKFCPCCQKTFEWWLAHSSKEKLQVTLEEQQRMAAAKQTERKECIRKRKKLVLRVGLVIGVLCIFVAIYMLRSKVIVPAGYYAQGLTCMEQEDYDEAKRYFAKAQAYKDSAEQYKKAEELIQVKTNYGIANNKFIAGEFYDAARIFGRILNFKDSAERYTKSLYKGVERDISKKETSATTLEALEILEKDGYKEIAYYFGEYYFLNEQYKEALDKWDSIESKEIYPNLEARMSKIRNKMLYQEASELAANLNVIEAYEKLENMDVELENSEHMKTEIKRAIDSGFLGKWRQTDSTLGTSNDRDSYIIIEAAYRDGELKFYLAYDIALKGKQPDKLKVEMEAVEENKRFLILEGDSLIENGIYVPKNKITKNGTNLKRETIRQIIPQKYNSGAGDTKEVGGETYVYETYE